MIWIFWPAAMPTPKPDVPEFGLPPVFSKRQPEMTTLRTNLPVPSPREVQLDGIGSVVPEVAADDAHVVARAVGVQQQPVAALVEVAALDEEVVDVRGVAVHEVRAAGHGDMAQLHLRAAARMPTPAHSRGPWP